MAAGLGPRSQASKGPGFAISVELLGRILAAGVQNQPLHGLNLEPLWMPTRNAPGMELRVETRSEALCALAEQVFS